MQYVILISPDDMAEIKEYTDYQTINNLVEGWYERCGVLAIGNKMMTVFCNEEFLFYDELKFNAIGTAFSNQPIYGNVVLLELGYNEDHERDALPLDKADAEQVCNAVNDYKKFFSSLLDTLHSHYDNNKPEPTAEIISMSEDSFRELIEE